jgi:hypothetical protein
MKARRLFFLALFTACFSLAACADEIEMKNGDRYVAKVVTLSNDTVTVQSEVLGTVSLARSKVAAIRMGSNLVPAGTASIAATRPAPAVAGASPLIATATPQISAQTNLIQQVQNQYLKDADPAAKAKFQELLIGVQSGQISTSDLKAQAQAVVTQLKTLKRDLGPEADEVLDGYATILENFLHDPSLATAGTTNSATALLQNLTSKSAADE